MSTPLDVIVIGAGPAGLAAAADTAGAGLKTLVLDKLGPGGVLINLGPMEGVSTDFNNGPHLVAVMTDDVTAAGGELGFGEVVKVTGDGPFVVETADGERRETRSVIVASGLNKGRLGIDGEEAWEGRGLSHCASCDGPLFTGQPVVVAGTDGWAAHEVRELTALAEHITVVGNGKDHFDAPNVTVVEGKVVAFEGSDFLEAVTVETGGSRQSVKANAIFVYGNQTPAAEFLSDLLARDATGHIVVDADGTASRPLAFAAGDVISGAPHTIEAARASGELAARTIIARLKS